MSTIGARVRQARKEQRLSQIELAKKANISQTTLSQLENGRNESSKELPSIALALGVDVHWLLTGEGYSKLLTPVNGSEYLKKSFAVWQNGDTPPTGMTPISYYKSVIGALGNGYANDEYVEEELLWFRNETISECNVNAAYAKAIKVRGESMMPELNDGQVIAIDTSATNIYDGEIYAFIVNNELKVKYLFKHGNGFRAVSRNDDKLRFPDEFYSAEDIENNNVVIVGQFWWKSETRRVRR